jgi:hypothetical protein
MIVNFRTEILIEIHASWFEYYVNKKKIDSGSFFRFFNFSDLAYEMNFQVNISEPRQELSEAR